MPIIAAAEITKDPCCLPPFKGESEGSLSIKPAQLAILDLNF